ncbi:glycosyltransferase family 4 protein [Aggregatilinea lenta]|uniref:glycosyltransferase family 4 protein n=1 Tax=Aggregatilinea lenta TaxID=913108 RepID=UPI000E5C1CF2|nr:glycosyltransferase family 4 protein [Aggregatilinea lenta]
MKIILLGVYPPPIGGVSIHLQRLSEYLLEHGHSVEVLDYPGTDGEIKPDYVFRLPRHLLGKAWYIMRYARQQPSNAVVHFHAAAMDRFRWIAPFMFLVFRKQPKFLTIHSGLLTGTLKYRLARAHIRFVLNRCRHVIPVTDELGKYLLELGLSPERMTVIPAYIGKIPEADNLPAELAQLKKTHKLVVTSGFLMAPYNFDVLIDVIPHLDCMKFHFIFVFYGATDPAYEATILRSLKQLNNVTILHNQPADVFLSVLHASDVYVRTTVMDGDAITIREALDFNTTVFATDSVKRPEACRLFKYNDPSSLCELFTDLPEASPDDKHVSASACNVQRLLGIYEAALSLS